MESAELSASILSTLAAALLLVLAGLGKKQLVWKPRRAPIRRRGRRR
jgi:hypothetical protein